MRHVCPKFTRKQLGKFKRFRILRHHLGRHGREDLVDKILGQSSGVLVQIKPQIALALVLVENAIERDEVFISVIHG